MILQHRLAIRLASILFVVLASALITPLLPRDLSYPTDKLPFTPCRVSSSTDSSPLLCTLLNPFVTWDSVHYLRIAQFTRTPPPPSLPPPQYNVSLTEYSETMIPFFPLYPALLRLLTPFPDQYALVFTGVLLSVVTTVLSSYLISPLFPNSSPTLTLLLLLSPINAFYTTISTESLTTLFTLLLLPHLTNHYTAAPYTCKSLLSFLFCVPLLLLLSSLRSTSLALLVFILTSWLLPCLPPLLSLECGAVLTSLRERRGYLPTTAGLVYALFLPINFHNIGSLVTHCVGAGGNVGATVCPEDLGVLGDLNYWSGMDLRNLYYLPSVYKSVQKTYWETGYAFSYYTIKNIPAILLAVPAVVISARLVRAHVLYLFRRGNKDESFLHSYRATPHVLHLVCTVLPVLVFAHTNVVTRIAFAHCPILYYWVALNVDRGGWEKWFVAAFVVVGGVMHANYLPWT